MGRTFEEAKQRGTILGAEAPKVYEGISTSPEIEIGMASEIVNLKSGELPSENELEETIEKRKKEIEASDREFDIDREIILSWAYDALRMVRCGKNSAIVPVEVQALRLGAGR